MIPQRNGNVCMSGHFSLIVMSLLCSEFNLIKMQIKLWLWKKSKKQVIIEGNSYHENMCTERASTFGKPVTVLFMLFVNTHNS